MADQFGQCDGVTVIQGDVTDQNLTESGFVPLAQGQVEVSVNFVIPKSSNTYQFEYLYVDALGVVNPGGIPPLVTSQTQYGFVVDLSAAPPIAGYVLRWRVVVTTLGPFTFVDAPESFRVALPVTGNLYTYTFVNARSTTSYGFTELRVENLVDDPTTVTPVNVMVVNKTQLTFEIAFNPTPPTPNYFLVGRTP